MSYKILVTGGAGFIGSQLVDKLVERGYEVRVFDNLDPQVHKDGKLPKYFNNEAEFIRGDIRNKIHLAKAMEDVNIICHLGAVVGIGQSMYQVKKYVDVNIGGTANILDVLVNNHHHIKKLIISGSATSYGECSYQCSSCGIVYPELRTKEMVKQGQWDPLCPKCGKEIKPVPIKEDKLLKCNFIYALTKKAQEELSLAIGRTYRIPTVILRYFNVYGSRQSLSNPYTGVMAVFSARLKSGKPPIIIENGLQTRDFVSVHDVVSATILAMEKEKANYQIFNVGSGKATGIRQVAAELIKLHGKDINPEISNIFRKGDVRHSLADISKIKTKLGWKPKVTFKEGLRELFEWYKNQPAEDRFEESLEELSRKGLI